MTYPSSDTSGAAAAPGYVAPSTDYASWIHRVGAYLIDSLVTAPFAILAVVLGRDTDAATGAPTLNAMYFVFIALALVLSGYNRWYLAGRTGQSWGRKALSIRLVGEQTGQPIGPLLAFARDLAHFVDSVICYVGYLFPLWDKKRQTLADKIVKTVVVR